MLVGSKQAMLRSGDDIRLSICSRSTKLRTIKSSHFSNWAKADPGAYVGVVRTAYWALSNNQGAEAASSVERELQATGRKGVVAALTAASLMLTGSSSRPLSSVPAFGLTLFETILKLASSVEFSADDEYEDDCVALTLQILPTLQVHSLIPWSSSK